MRWRPSRSSVLAARTAGRLLAIGLIVAVGGCAEVAPTPSGPRPDSADRPYLLPPAEGYPAAVEPLVGARLDELHRRLQVEGATAEVRRLAAALAGDRAELPPAQVLVAQIDFAAGALDAARQRLQPIAAAVPDYLAAQLLIARIAEKLGDLPEAFAAYLAMADRNSAAALRVAQIRTRTLEIVANRLADALARGRLEQAGEQLTRLEDWAPGSIATLEGARQLAAATGDAAAELEAVRALRLQRPDDAGLRDRHATLEVEAGDPGMGINILQEMAGERPDDAEIGRRLSRARFRWRLVLLPGEVQQLMSLPELTRGDLAALLYWLFPSVRYARPQTARIANDVFDHAFREEIVRVINLGLMEVNPNLHQFAPQRTVTRAEALSAMLRVVAASRPQLPCLGAVAEGSRFSWPIACGAAASCGLLAAEADCLPAAGVAGAEAVELCRLTQELLGPA